VLPRWRVGLLSQNRARLFSHNYQRKAGYTRVDLSPPAGASPVAAAAAAAQRVASDWYREPEDLAVFDAALAEALATVPDGPAELLGVEFGRQVGDAILAWRANDGARSEVPYTPGTEPGDWNRTFPDFVPPLLTQWPFVTPFAMTTPAQFRPAAPPALDSIEYAADVNEIKELGRFDSTTRTADETEIALFWADGGGTYTPPGVAVAKRRPSGRSLPGPAHCRCGSRACTISDSTRAAPWQTLIRGFFGRNRETCASVRRRRASSGDVRIGREDDRPRSC